MGVFFCRRKETMPKVDDTFLLYYLEDFAEFSEDNPTCIFCLSESTVQIILSALRFSEWPTRWRLNRQDNSRAIDRVYWDTIKYFSELAHKEIIRDMECDFQAGFETLAEAITSASNASAIDRLAQAVGNLVARQCCEGQSNLTTNGGIVSTIDDGDGNTIPIYGTQPPATIPETGFPPNYESEEDYLNDKCRLANMVFDGWLGTMRGLGAITVFNATALATLIGLALASVIIMPPAAIPVMIVSLLALGGFVAMFVQLADQLQENRQSIICDLYNSDTVETMTELLSDALDVAIGALEVAGPVGALLKTVALVLVNSDTLSQLLNGAATLGYPDADCSMCVESVRIFDYCSEATTLLEGELTFNVTSQYQCATSNPCHTAYIFFDVDEEGTLMPEPSRFQIVAADLDGFTPGCYSYLGEPADFVFYDENQAVLDVATDPQGICCNIILLVSSTPFTGTITIERCQE